MAEETIKTLQSKNLRLKFFLRNARLKAECLLGKNRDIKERFAQQRKKGFSDFPVFIISYDRLTFLKRTIAALERCGVPNIKIIDNASTYPPLLEYYKTIPYEVIYVGENLGSRVFWKSPLFARYRNDFYAVTDSDIELTEDCPADVIENLFSILEKYPFVRKVGVSLKIDDINENNVFSKDVKEWESQFFKAPIKGAVKGKDAYYASVDTTLAVWLPDDIAEGIPFLRAIRSAPPYEARHLAWYKAASDLDEEDKYYSEHRSNGWWDNVQGEVTMD